MIQLTSFPAIVQQLCYSIWRAITCARISKEVLGMMEEGFDQRPHECKAKVLINELLHTATSIAPIIKQS
jgi:hypothetical protein